MKTIIFDFDGTLGDTQSVVIKSFKETFVEGGYEEPSSEACAAIIGLTLEDCFKVMMKCSDDEAVRLGKIYTRIFKVNVEKVHVKPFPGVVETLAELKQQHYQIGIATSRAKHSILEIIPEEIDQYVDMLVAPQDVINGKPAADLAIKILEAFDAEPKETFVVGDASYDILMGKNAGCKTCAVTYGNGTMEELEACKPDFMIDHFSDLLKVL